MKWVNLINGADVFFLPLDQDLQTIESALNTTAARKGKKLKMRVGAWVCASTAESERVLRVEVVGTRDRYIQNISQERKQAREQARAERYKRIVELKTNGASVSEIGEIMGLGNNRIYQILREGRDDYVKKPRDKEFREKMQIKIDARKERIKNEKEKLENTIIKMKRKGISGREIAVAVGCSHQTIYNILKKLGENEW